MLVIYLLQCFFCRTVQFKFHDIDEFVCLQDKVDAPFACMIFHFGIEATRFDRAAFSVYLISISSFISISSPCVS